jgi:DNA-binding MarR family transcriptional regulator
MDSPARGQLSEAALETSRLVLEFLHAAYATRQFDVNGAHSAGSGEQPSGTHDSASTGISAHTVRAAVHVYQHGDRTVGQLASGLGISYGWASRVVEELEATGYAIRERDVDDRRVVRVRLNPLRIQVVERALEWRGRVVEEALAPLDESEREAVCVFLRRVTELMRETGPGQA